MYMSQGEFVFNASSAPEWYKSKEAKSSLGFIITSIKINKAVNTHTHR